MREINLSTREKTAWGVSIGALVLLGLVGVVTRRTATREELRAPADPYRAALAEVDPIVAHTTCAYSYEAEGSTGMAIREYRELVKLNPDDITAHGMLSALYFKMNDRDKAVAEILEVLRIDPSKWAQREILADTYCETGDYERSCREYEEVLRYSPESSEVHCKLGRVYQLGGRYPLARAAFQEAVETDPASAEAHLGLGLSLLALGDRAGAAKELELLKGLNPDTAGPLAAALGKNGASSAGPAAR